MITKPISKDQSQIVANLDYSTMERIAVGLSRLLLESIVLGLIQVSLAKNFARVEVGLMMNLLGHQPLQQLQTVVKTETDGAEMIPIIQISSQIFSRNSKRMGNMWMSQTNGEIDKFLGTLSKDHKKIVSKSILVRTHRCTILQYSSQDLIMGFLKFNNLQAIIQPLKVTATTR